MSDEHLGIVELAEICARMRAVNLDLFEELGAWVTATDGGAPQRHFATACHRHAWHAELWERRTPSIPGLQQESNADPSAAGNRAGQLGATPDAAAYSARLDDLLGELAELAARIDADLDPSTARVITLIRNDLAELRTAWRHSSAVRILVQPPS